MNYVNFPGTIRYWPSVAHESSFVEISGDLQGQECYSLTDIQPVGSILATTTSTVCLIHFTGGQQQQTADGRSGIACRMLKIPQGILGGISRRVSSLFWGSMNSGIEAVSKVVEEL